MVCVGSPSEKNGNLGLSQIRRAVEEIALHARDRRKPLVIAIRSTVFPGTCDELSPAFAEFRNVSLVCHPEFLREGSAVQDFLEPPLIVVGGPDPAYRRVGDLYSALPVSPCLVSLRTAEMIKYACDA